MDSIDTNTYKSEWAWTNWINTWSSDMLAKGKVDFVSGL